MKRQRRNKQEEKRKNEPRRRSNLWSEEENRAENREEESVLDLQSQLEAHHPCRALNQDPGRGARSVRASFFFLSSSCYSHPCARLAVPPV